MEQIQICESINDQYLYTLNSFDGNVIINFTKSKILFRSYTIFKNGYPNDEIYYLQERFLNNNLKHHVLYEVINSLWIKEIISINRTHSRHHDKLFDTTRHFLIFFEDETFECLAESYEIQ